MSRTRLLIGAKTTVTIDVVWLIWTLIAFLIFTYLPVYVDTDPTLAIKSIIGFTLLLGGTAMTLVLIGFKADSFYSLGDFVGSIGYIIVSLLAVFMVNRVTTSLQLSSVPISGTLFIMLMGIAEEAIFRGFLLTLLQKMTGSSLLAVLGSSGVGMIYHSAVYGASVTNLAIVFGSFCVLGFMYVLSGHRLSVPMTAHALINLLSSV